MHGNLPEPLMSGFARLSGTRCLVCMHARCMANILFQMLAYLHWH